MNFLPAFLGFAAVDMNHKTIWNLRGQSIYAALQNSSYGIFQIRHIARREADTGRPALAHYSSVVYAIA